MATLPTPGLRRTYASAPAEEIILQTLELYHPSWNRSYWLTNYTEAFQAVLEDGSAQTFIVMPFALKIPRLDGQGQQDMQLSIANIDREMSEALETAIEVMPQQSIRAVYRVFLGSDKTTPQLEPLVLGIDGARLTLETLTATAGRTDVLNLRFPNQVFSVELYPGLDR